MSDKIMKLCIAGVATSKTNDDLMKLLIAGIAIIIFILLAVLAYMYLKDKLNKKNESEEIEKITNEVDEKKAQKSIFKFMEFDTVEDNMIVQDGGKRYLMVIECKGINYDLLSNVEKNGIEQGFISFLNTLKYEIQIYVQTRKVNLAQSTMKYRERLKIIENDMREEEAKYQDMQRRGNYTKDEILKEIKEVTKKRNLYEYGRDVIENTEQMSQDSDLTTKSYYIIVPYYTDEITSAGDYDKKEISSMAFSELYTRAQSLVSALTECDVRGKIMNSQEIIELLFVAYNREQHDLYDFEEYMTQSGFNTFYSISEDVLQKRIKALDEQIVTKANEKAVEAYRRASKKSAELRRQIEDRERRMQEYIDSLSEAVIENEAVNIGRDMVNRSKQEIKNMNEEEKARKQVKIDKNNSGKIKDDLEDSLEEPVVKKSKKKISDLTEEEIRRLKIKKKKRLLREREAKANGKKEE